MTTSPFGPSQPLPQPGQPVDPNGIGAVVVPVPGPGPWEPQQPQVSRRSVVPVEWFRRMPGGGTTYAPVDDAPADDRN